MKSLAIHSAWLSGLGALALMGTVATTVPASAKCMIDEGNGRSTPCSALYKANNSNGAGISYQGGCSGSSCLYKPQKKQKKTK
jgi:hypothetical protein